MKLVRRFLGAEQGNILLTERQIDWSQGIQGSQLAWIDLEQADMGHRFGHGVRRDGLLPALALLLHPGSPFCSPHWENEHLCTRPLRLQMASFLPLAKPLSDSSLPCAL